jgi:dipeptidyl aminopeptidase/acylaminoacyl peptidase
MNYKPIKAFTLLLILCGTKLNAQTVTRFQPTHEQMVERYKRAEKIDDLTKDAVFKSTVEAHWAADGKSFWYCNVLKGDVREYVWVDAASGKKEPAFNHQKLAEALQKNGAKADASHLMITEIVKKQSVPTTQLKTAEGWFELSADGGSVSKIAAPTTGDAVAAGGRGRRGGARGNFRNGSTSPDKKWEAYIEKGNVFIKPASGGAPVQFTTNGTDADPYGAMAWSPDSKYLAGYLIHPVKDTAVYFVLSSVPGTKRGQLKGRPYKQPGDPFTTYDLYLFPVDQQKAVKVNTETLDFDNNGPILHWRYDNPRYFTYEKFDRGHQRLRVIEVDANTAQIRNVVDEKTKTFIYRDRQYLYYPAGSNLLIRSSEKDGWRHLYQVDLVTGTEKLITKGNWVVRNVDSVDIVKKEVWFSASGMNAGEDPYLIYHYRVSFNGTNLVCLTPDKGNHLVVFSPDKKYFIDNYSMVNVPPVTKLRRSSDGKEIALLEEADVSYYKTTGVSPPEVFVAKGRDGVTDIWGIISRPSDYDPTKKYPVLENIYAGPHDSFVPKSFVPYSEMQSLAELGFVVVMIDGMGTANRSKAFHDVCWQNLADAGLPDRILWIKALAKKYPYVDAERVGIYGTSAGGQNSLGALLYHPEFYKAAVSACGCHDNRVDKQWWNEQWMGYPIGKHYEEQSNVTNAYKLQGNVLLIVGEADTNVPPESTYRVADALIKARKDFDFLSVPGMDHGDGGPFGRMKKRNFFVKHLMGVDPPDYNSGEVPQKMEVGRERWAFQ